MQKHIPRVSDGEEIGENPGELQPKAESKFGPHKIT